MSVSISRLAEEDLAQIYGFLPLLSFAFLPAGHEFHDLHERSTDVLHVWVEATFLFPKPADALTLLRGEFGHSPINVGLVG